uniref:85 kDa calcium-independent phospholipase A2 n=1 Tax=Ascaris suum TaxID=6253 RepID=F1L5F9_ASCSU
MPSSKCAHMLSASKKLERIHNLIQFAKTVTKNQLTCKLIDCWSQPQSSITEVRILLTLGADPDNLYKDDYGKKELEDRIANGNVCAICAEKYNDFLQYAQMIHEAQFGQAPILIQRQRRCKKGLIALALDGGGMRGLVSVVSLLFASRRIFGDEYLPNIVDWMVGTSTGSMLGLSLMKGLTLTETFFLYWDMKNEIFLDGSTVKRLFGNMVDRQTRNMEDVLLKCFPDEFTFLSCSKRLTVPALDISTTPAKLHVFRNYSVNTESLMEDTLFRDAARASSAAPTYFHPHIINGKTLVDGSFVANCPLNILFKEFDQCNRNGSTISLAAIISVGTGEPLATARKYKSGSNITAKGKNIIHLSSLLLEQVVGHEQSGLESAKDRCLAQNIPFVRLSPKGINVRIDQIDDGKLMDMIWTTLKYLTDHTAEVDKLGRILYELIGENNDCRIRSHTVL